MKDEYLLGFEAYLKLAEQTLYARLKHVHKQSDGELYKENQVAHTMALIGTIEAAREVAQLTGRGWWDGPDEVPF